LTKLLTTRKILQLTFLAHSIVQSLREVWATKSSSLRKRAGKCVESSITEHHIARILLKFDSLVHCEPQDENDWREAMHWYSVIATFSSKCYVFTLVMYISFIICN